MGPKISLNSIIKPSIIPKNTYEVRFVRISKSECKSHINKSTEFIDSIYAKGIISNEDYNYYIAALANWERHCSHAMLELTIINLITKEKTKLLHPITKSENDFEIIGPLSQYKLGVKNQYYNVVWLTERLGITSHGLIPVVESANELTFQELYYDEVKNCYVDKNNNSKITNFTNLTKENVDKITDDFINFVESNEIKKVDIAALSDIQNEVIALKLIEEYQTNAFDKNTYEDISESIDNYCENLLIEFNKPLNFNWAKKSDEL